MLVENSHQIFVAVSRGGGERVLPVAVTEPFYCREWVDLHCGEYFGSVVEYLRSLQRNYIPAQQYVHELLAELLAVDDRLGELYQLLQ